MNRIAQCVHHVTILVVNASAEAITNAFLVLLSLTQTESTTLNLRNNALVNQDLQISWVRLIVYLATILANSAIMVQTGAVDSVTQIQIVWINTTFLPQIVLVNLGFMR
jgi:hypothetical protein